MDSTENKPSLEKAKRYNTCYYLGGSINADNYIPAQYAKLLAVTEMREYGDCWLEYDIRLTQTNENGEPIVLRGLTQNELTNFVL
jgi:hypothetical protein